MPSKAEDSIVGQVQYTSAYPGETLLDIARQFDLGYEQIIKANSSINRWVPREGGSVLIPSQYILPPGDRRGIVLNLAERRLYYYPPHQGTFHSKEVMTYPVSIGRMNWSTPLGKTTIVRKEINPAWYPPESIREEAEIEGEFLPEVIPGGAINNPLGKYALRLGVKGYAIHGVNERKAFGIGMNVTHGCIRMYPEDIEELFQNVSVGTSVSIIYAPLKIGWKDNILYLEVHRPLDEDERFENQEEDFSEEYVYDYVRTQGESSDDIDERAIHNAYRNADGIPIAVGTRFLR